MQTILTIDFDIIMNPSIQLYNDMAGAPWEERLQRHSLLHHLEVDFNTYSKLTDYLLKLFKTIPKNNVHFIKDHEKIISYCNKNDALNVINIDHHHDCAYKPKDVENFIEQLDCGNWGKYLQEQYNLQGYFWICGNNAMMPSSSIQNLISGFKTTDIKNINCNTLPIPDTLVICLSPPWVPPYITSLYYTWMDIANTIYNTHFEIEG